jgi:hypothetical protein
MICHHNMALIDSLALYQVMLCCNPTQTLKRTHHVLVLLLP